ncbi:MAG: hypothetical protein RL660_1573 [Bacteroidota bacterium]|jgi:hypothetical protein
MPYTYLIVVRYKWWAVPFAFLSMALFNLPLWFKKAIPFYKLMGCGRNGTFDKSPDLRQWCILFTSDALHASPYKLLGPFVNFWFKVFTYEQASITLGTLTSHGEWEKTNPFGNPKLSYSKGTLAVLTRANINWSKMKNFWQHVDGVAQTLKQSKGFIKSIGIGEIPWKKQATISFWQNEESMKQFAYKQREHAEVVEKTRKEKWYREDLFCRFSVVAASGHLAGFNWGDLVTAT